MSGQWPDPNGKWYRRTMVATLLVGVAWLAFDAFHLALAMLDPEPVQPLAWIRLAAGTAAAVLLILQWALYRRRASRS